MNNEQLLFLKISLIERREVVLLYNVFMDR